MMTLDDKALEAAAEALCQATLFDGNGHGCGGFCQAKAGFAKQAEAAIAAYLTASPAPQDDEDPHQTIHIYEGDGALIVRENGNKDLIGVEHPSLRAGFDFDGPAAPQAGVTEAMVRAAVEAYDAVSADHVNVTEMQANLGKVERSNA